MKLTKSQLRDPKFNSYEKCLVTGQVPILCECGDCHGPALILPALTMKAPSTGTTVCPICWHPVVGRILWSVASAGGKLRIDDSKYNATAVALSDLGLLKKRGHQYLITPAGLAVLSLKESVGWEMELAHKRGAYRTETLLRGAKSSGYWSQDDTWGQWIHHRHGSAAKVGPIGVKAGAMRFGFGTAHAL